MHSRYVLADSNSPIAVCEKKCGLRECHSKGFHSFSACPCFCLACFVFSFRVTWKY